MEKVITSTYISREAKMKAKEWAAKTGYSVNDLIEILLRQFFDLPIALNEITVDKRKIAKVIEQGAVNLDDPTEKEYWDALWKAYKSARDWSRLNTESWATDVRRNRFYLDPINPKDVLDFIRKKEEK